jgi:hypothetical protein
VSTHTIPRDLDVVQRENASASRLRKRSALVAELPGARSEPVLEAVHTDHPRLFARLWALPGIRRWQVGDQEMRALFRLEALPLVALLIRARRRRRPESAAHLQKLPDPAISGPSAA